VEQEIQNIQVSRQLAALDRRKEQIKSAARRLNTSTVGEKNSGTAEPPGGVRRQDGIPRGRIRFFQRHIWMNPTTA